MKKLFLLLALFGVLCSGCEITVDWGKDSEKSQFSIDGDGDYLVRAEGDTLVIKVSTNLEYDVIIPDDATWITLDSTRALRIESLVFKVDKNDEPSERSVTILFIDAEGDRLQEINIIQECNEEIVPNNQIWYTSVDCSIVNPSCKDYEGNEVGVFATFGANIISNTYDDGKGVITFDGEITKIGDNAFNRLPFLQDVADDPMSSVVIPESVTEIGTYAFSGCKNLASISIPNRVTVIKDYAFGACFSLTSVNIPDSVTELGRRVFSNCSSLHEFRGKYASDDGRCLIDDGVLCEFAPAGLTSYIIPDCVTKIGESVFNDCANLASVTIPESVVSIGEYAFAGCTSLASITIPDSVTSIEFSAFRGCSNLANISIPDSVTKIGKYAFAHCWNMVSATIGNGVRTIESSLFWDCIRLKTLSIGGNVTDIGEFAFQECVSLTSVTIPDSVTVIGEYAFAYCPSLKRVDMGAGVKTIHDYAFQNCDALTSVYISDLKAWYNIDYAIPELEDGTVYLTANPLCYARNLYLNNSLVTDIVVPEDVTEIKPLTFVGCKNVKNLTIHENVISIGALAFFGCVDIDNVYCHPTTPPSMGFRVFGDWDAPSIDCRIYVPYYSYNAYLGADGWNTYASQITTL